MKPNSSYRFTNIKLLIYKKAGRLLLLWFIIIFILCATPGRFIPSSSWLELLSFDKLVHAGIFFILTALCFIWQLKNNRSYYHLILYVIIAVCYGALLEWMQANVFTQRNADWLDIMANTSGCLMALLLYKKINKVFTNIEY